MNSPDDITPNVETPIQKVGDSTRQLRRRRLVTGAGAGFVVLGSRSVLANECYNPSETLSGARSHLNGNLPECVGRSPEIWWQATENGETQGDVSWSNLGLSTSTDPWDTPFHPLFPGSKFSGMSLLDVLRANGSVDTHKLGFHMIGALLNIRAGLVDQRVMTEDYLLNTLWPDGPNNSNSPFLNDPEAIKAFLKNTGIVE